MGNYAGLTVTTSTGSGSLLGRIVSGIGDFNGDGFDDFLVTAPSAYEFDAGYGSSNGLSYVVFGEEDGPPSLNVGDLDGSNGFAILPGDVSDPIFGYSFSGNRLRLAKGIGDFNGDGLADIAVARSSYYSAEYSYSANGEAFATPNQIFVIFGTEAAQGSVLRVSDLGEGEVLSVGGLSGPISSIEAAGDINGDGINDLILNQYEWPTSRYNYNNRDVGERPALGYVMFGAADSADAGVVDVRDLDGSDGFAVLGLPTLTDGGGGFYGGYYGFEAQGSEIVSLGDIDGDGLDDLLIRMSRTSPAQRYQYEYYVEETYDPTPDMPGSGDEFPTQVGVNPTTVYYTQITRRAYVLLGSENDARSDGAIEVQGDDYDGGDGLIRLSWTDIDANTSSSSSDYGDYVWQSFDVAGVGDVNGDGYDDAALSFANLLSVGGGDDVFEPRNGVVYVVFGGPDGVDTDAYGTDTETGMPVDFGLRPGEGADVVLYNTSRDSADRAEGFGKVITAAGDVNNDGYGDVLISEVAYRFDETGGESGSVYLVFGGANLQGAALDLALDADGLEGIGYRFVGADLDHQYQTLGSNVVDRQWLSAAGDLNGDGFDDFLIGAPNDTEQGGYARTGGTAFVVYGGIDGLETADNADGTNDNVINLDNLGVDVQTGALPIEVSLQNAGSFSENLNEGQSGTTIFTFVARRTGDLSQAVSFDYAVSGYYTFDAAQASDFVGGVLPSGTVTFAAGAATAQIEIAAQGDTVIEQTEAFQIELSNLVLPDGATGGFTGDLISFAEIVNDDFPITVRAFSTGVTEGSGNLNFIVQRSGDTASAATVSYSLQSDTFSPASDADIVDGLPQTGTVDFAAGETQKTVTFVPVDDTLIEQTERLLFQLTGITSTNPDAIFDLQSSAVTGSIFNDDFPVFLRVGGNQVFEASGTPISFTITRSGDTEAQVEVFYEFTPYPGAGANAADFVGGFPANGSYIFAPGETTRTLTFAIQDDQIAEGAEYIEMRLTNAIAAEGVTIDRQTAPAYGGIINDDFNIELSVLGAAGAEDGGPITVTIRRSGRIDAAVDVDYAVALGTFGGAATQADVTQTMPLTGTVSFASGETTKTFTVTPVADTLIEANEFLEVRLTDARTTSGVAITRQTNPSFIQITNDDFAVEISASGEARLENDGTLRATITRNGRLDVEVTVDYRLATFDVEADDLQQALPLTGSVTFAPNERTKTITINPVADEVIEETEYVEFTVSNARLTGASAGGTAQIVVQSFPAYLEIINDDFPIYVRSGAATANEGENLNFIIYRSGELDAAVTVGWALRNYIYSSNATGIDFASGLPQSGNVSFAAGETQKTVTIATVNDALVEGTEFVEFVLTGSTTASTVPVELATSPAYGYIYDNDFNIVVRASYASAYEDSGELAFVIYRSGELNANVTVSYSIGSASFSAATSADITGGLPKTGTVVFAANETSKVVRLGIVADTLVESTEYVQLDLTGATTTSAFGLDVQTSPAYGVIYNDDFNIDLGVQGAYVNEGDALTFTLTRSGDTSAAVTVTYGITGITNGDAAESGDVTGGLPQGGSVTFGIGETFKTVTLQTTEDAVEEGNEGVALTLLSATSTSGRLITGVGSVATGYILNDDLPVEFSASGAYGFEDAGPLTFTVYRSGNTAVAASVDYSFTPYPFGNGAVSDDITGGLPQAGVLNFAAGETRKTISVTPVADRQIEATEYLQLTLANASAPGGIRTTLPGGPAYGYIYNDDYAPRITVSGGSNIQEGRSGLAPVVFTFTRAGDLLDTTTVTYDLLPLGPVPADSQDIDGFLPGFGQTVTFAPGQTTATAVVNIIGDGIIEPHESFQLRVTNISSSLSTSYDLVGGLTNVTILNDDGRPPVLPPGIGIGGFVFGDPHIVTLDGLTYSFMAVGEFVMLESIPGARDPFQVQARFEPAQGSSLVSLTTRVAVEAAGKVVEFVASGPDHLLIDGVPTTINPDEGAIDIDGDDVPDVFLSLEDGRTVFTVVLNSTNEQMTVEVMDGYLNMGLFLGSDREGAVRGLMGNADGQTGNDLALRDGTELDQPVPFDQLYGDFAASWRLGGTEATSLFTYGAGEDTETFTDLSFPAGVIDLATVPASIRNAAAAAADAAGITDPILREAAILDYIFTGNPSFLTGASDVDADTTEELEIDDAPVIPVSVGVSAVQAQITEGDTGSTDISFRIYRTGPTDEAITVSYALGGVTADDLEAGTAFSGTVVLAAGVAETLLALTVTGDLTTEDSEALVVSLTGTTLGSIGAATGQTTIVTDDFAPIAEDDSFTVAADGTLQESLFGADAAGLADRDPDADPISVVSVNGTALILGELDIALAYGSATVSADGSLSYRTDSRASALAPGAIAIESFVYQISDGQGGFDTATANIAVQAPAASENTAPVANDLTLTENEDVPSVLFSLAGLTEDAEGNATEWAVTNVVGGTLGGFDPATGFGSFIPTANFNGEARIDFTVTDAGGLTDSGSIVVKVTPVNDAPVAVADAVVTLRPGQSVALIGATLLANDTDADGDALSITQFFATTAQGGTVENTAFDTFTYTPAAGFTGTDTFSYVVSDGFGGTTNATLGIEVVNSAPVAVADAVVTLRPGQSIVLTGAALLANDTDADGDALSITQFFATTAQGGTVENTAFDTFTYTPPAGFTGTDTFTYVVSDGFGGTTNATLGIEVVNSAPVAVADAVVTLRPGQSIVLTGAALLANDTDADGDALSITQFFATTAEGGTVENTAFDSFTYTPPAGFTGTDTFTYVVSDGFGGTTNATLSIEVINSAPTAVADAFDVAGDAGAFTANLLTNDSDPDADSFGVSSFTDAANGVVSVAANGDFSYTPDAGFSGTDSFTYTVADSFGATATATVTLTVEEDGIGFNVIEAAPNQPFLRGTVGADALIIGTSRSTQAFGDEGDDVFVFGSTAGDGRRDVAYIRDFEQGSDLIDLGDVGFTFRAVGPNTVITLAGADRDSLTVSGVILTEADFTNEWTSRDDGIIA